MKSRLKYQDLYLYIWSSQIDKEKVCFFPSNLKLFITTDDA